MIQRNFKYQEDKSSKFWNITLEDCSHTVTYGKLGAAGRTQAKSFDTEAEAKKSYEKLIQQKQKKGYIEVATDNNEVREEKPKDKYSILEQAEEQIETIPQKLEITRSIDLNPEDWHWATWRPRIPLSKPEVKPFDLTKAKNNLAKVFKLSRYQAPCTRLENWHKAKIDDFISREEALFWLVAINYEPHNCDRENYQQLIKQDFQRFFEDINSEQIDDSISIDRAISLLVDGYYIRDIPSHVASIVYALFPLTDFIKRLVRRVLDNPRDNSKECYALKFIIVGFEQHIWHYLTCSEIAELRQGISPLIKSQNPNILQVLNYFFVYLGMHEETLELLKSKTKLVPSYASPNEYRFLAGLGSATVAESQMRRLNFVPNYDALHIRICLANTEYSALDLIRNGILKTYNKESTTKLLKTFALVKAPEAAPYMLELWLASKVPGIARQWLEDNPIHSIVGLIPVAAELSTPLKVTVKEMSRAAVDFLLGLKRKGYEDLIRQAIAKESPEIAAVIIQKVLEIEELNYEPLDEQNTPQWLQQRVAEILNSPKKPKPISWVSPVDLPPLIVNHKCLNEEQVNACLIALRQTITDSPHPFIKDTLDSPHPLVEDIKKYCDKPDGQGVSPDRRRDDWQSFALRASLRTSIDNFIWSLFERWLSGGAPKKEDWAMLALGLLGGDEIAMKFTPYLRKWPGESQHHRAVLGLQCLRAIGSDTALMQINGIARKIKYKGLRARAQECIQAIAKDRKLSPDELEDRIIPSLGLDEKGKRVFDYGDRQFHFVLGQDLKPMVRDEQGKLKANLPKPAKKDNEELATQALADWKLLKKQVRETLKIQTVRLEQAMTAQRRWQWREFEDLLANHPFMTHLVQRIIWAGYDANHNLVNTFRLAEDRTYANAEDEAIEPHNIATVSIVHPVCLTLEQRSAWGETLSDYEIIPPFPQINREIYSVTPEEAETIEITRFKNITIPGITLLRTMESLGWLKGGLHDHGDFAVNYKYFPQADITAIIGDYESQHAAQDSIWGDDAIDGCLFFHGKIEQPYEYPLPGSWYDKNHFQGSHLKLKDVDALVMSEVLRDLYIVTSKAK